MKWSFSEWLLHWSLDHSQIMFASDHRPLCMNSNCMWQIIYGWEKWKPWGPDFILNSIQVIKKLISYPQRLTLGLGSLDPRPPLFEICLAKCPHLAKPSTHRTATWPNIVSTIAITAILQMSVRRYKIR